MLDMDTRCVLLGIRQTGSLEAGQIYPPNGKAGVWRWWWDGGVGRDISWFGGVTGISRHDRREASAFREARWWEEACRHYAHTISAQR